MPSQSRKGLSLEKKPFKTLCTLELDKKNLMHIQNLVIGQTIKPLISSLYLWNFIHNTSIVKMFLFKWDVWCTIMGSLRVHQNLMCMHNERCCCQVSLLWQLTLLMVLMFIVCCSFCCSCSSSPWFIVTIHVVVHVPFALGP